MQPRRVGSVVLLFGIVLTARPVPAADEVSDPGPLFTSTGIWSRLRSEPVKKDLKLTNEQSEAFSKIWKKQQQNESGDAEAFYNYKGADKQAWGRSVTKKRADELFTAIEPTLSSNQVKRLKQIMLQSKGITIFNYPEIRSELGLTEAEAAGLRATHEKIRKGVLQQYFDKKITQPEAAQIYETTLKHGVHDGVRAELNAEQRTKLAELLGPPFAFPK